MEETATEIKDEKLSFVIDGEEFWTRKGVMNEMKIGATTLAKEIRIGNITPNIFTFGYGFPKDSVRQWMNKRKKKFSDKLRAKK